MKRLLAATGLLVSVQIGSMGLGCTGGPDGGGGTSAEGSGGTTTGGGSNQDACHDCFGCVTTCLPAGYPTCQSYFAAVCGQGGAGGQGGEGGQGGQGGFGGEVP